jgi:hypothetical protein
MGRSTKWREMAMAMVNIEELKRLHAFLSTRWPNGLPHNQCNRTAYIVQKLLGGLVAGGWPRDDRTGLKINRGFCDSTGKWRFHYWNVIGNYIVDLTAGQFEDDSIIFTDKNDPRYCAIVTGLPDDLKDFESTRTSIAAEWLAEYVSLTR